jgi:hypothetical protein
MAKGKDDRETREKAAKKACLLGHVEKGSEILADLFVETNDPTYVYNQGRCFEQNGKNDQALLRFKEYQRKARGLSSADLDALSKKIEELETATGQHAAPQPTPVAAPPPVMPSSLASAAPPERANAIEPLGIVQAAPPPEPEPSPPLYKRWWFWGGVGAVVAGGVVTGVLLSRKSAPSSPSCDGSIACVP